MEAIEEFQRMVGAPFEGLLQQYWYILVLIGVVLVWYLLDSPGFRRSNVAVGVDLTVGDDDGDGGDGGGDGGGD